MQLKILIPILAFLLIFNANSQENPSEVEIIEFCDQEAEFPGGNAALQKFLAKNLIYPETAIKHEDEGKVFVSFVIEIDGSISTIKVEKGVSRELDREAKRLIRKMPRWIPGEVGQKTVRTRVRLPIIFILE